MRKGLQNIQNSENSNYKIIAVDDEQGIIDSLSIFLKRSGYDFTGITDPEEAIERVKNEHFDLMILDFIMTPFHGDQVVEEIRKFNKELYILLLTGHKDLAPPLETIRRLDIQGYCEKSDKFDQLLLLIESGIKSIKQMNEIKHINEELADTYEKLEQAYLESIQTLRYTVEAKDTYTRGHSDRVSEFSVLLGKKVGLAEQDLRTLQIGGLFHDIGKIGVPDTILQKESKLTDDEYSEIKNKLEFTDEKLQKNESELQEMGKKAKEKEKIIEKLKEDIEVLTSKNNILQNQLNVWHENLNVYSDLLEKIRNCSSMKEFYQKIGLDDCSEESKILKLVIAIGKEKQFSKNLYDFMKTEKKQNKKELSYDEKQVYDAVNKCYRMAANVEFDLFVLPDKKSVLEDCSDKMDFDAKDMEDLMDSKNKGFKIAKIIYVPALLSLDNGEIVGKCLVEGKMS